MIAIAKDVWRIARERAADDQEWQLELLLRPEGDRRVATQAVRDALDEMFTAYRSSDAWDAEALGEASAGDWRCAELSNGVRLDVEECDEFDIVLPMITAALERRGVSGRLGLYRAPRGFSAPRVGHAIVGRARIRGERVVGQRPQDRRWAADPDAVRRFLGAAEQWCRELGDGAEQSISIGGLAPIAVAPDEEVLRRVVESFGSKITDIAARTDDEFRLIRCVSPGTASFAVGGARLEHGDWQTPLAGLIDLLRASADLLAYAFLRRAWDIGGAMIDDVRFDWPPRPDAPHGPVYVIEAFENAYAPDAYGAQLLGPDYARRVPSAPSFRTQPIGLGSVWLEHTDLEAWFAAPLVPLGESHVWREIALSETPPLLHTARAELASMLQTPERLEQAGLPPGVTRRTDQVRLRR